MSMATLRAGRVQELLRIGDPLPTLEGQLLTGRDAALPQAASGKVALVPVEAWADWYRRTIGSRADVALFEVPMIGGVARLGRWFIDRGMRSGTPVDLHDQVLTVYGGTDVWKRRLSHSPEHKDDAYLIVVDREGVVRWLHHGAFDQSRSDELDALLTSLAGGPRAEAGHERAHGRREP
jgi:glucose dehydrogenase